MIFTCFSTRVRFCETLSENCSCCCNWKTGEKGLAGVKDSVEVSRKAGQSGWLKVIKFPSAK
ncbi:hypothetical protein BME90_19135 [Klebsiella quasipneumoniae subsp. similipneumoniae]|nr:hypothetical protein BME90_19135 [Klebsiella quasipneumoniae subsp. similipneumoniae]OVV14936.1 hypothetical protein BME89_16690 [Klebsiella quasipneumoniae subsp. similipneumoniae]